MEYHCKRLGTLRFVAGISQFIAESSDLLLEGETLSATRRHGHTAENTQRHKL